MMKERILVVDDEKDIQAILQYNLEKEGFVVDVASSAEEAENKLTNTHRLILLDVMMEGISGFTLAERLRKKENHVPIIFLTAKNSENDVLTGFSSGGDDYIAKPFSMKEVVSAGKSAVATCAVGYSPRGGELEFSGVGDRFADYPGDRGWE